MAKKLNTKVAVIGIILIVIFVGGVSSYLVYRQIQRNPERALIKGREALAAGDYLKAESYLGAAYAYGKTDQYQIERLFELAEFHLINNEQHEANWGKAMGCWKQIVTNDTSNLEARRKLLDFYFQAADAGDPRLWNDVHKNTNEILDVLKSKNVEPDNVLLKTHAKAMLMMASRGETTERSQLLNESSEILKGLAEKYPNDEEIYLLLAEASNLEGELGRLSGLIDSVEKNRQKSLDWLKAGLEKADDKATAAANMFVFKRQLLANDPNQLKQLRTEIETCSKQITPNDKFWIVTSAFYEIPGDQSPQAELNRAIEAVRQAINLQPQNVEYNIRMSKLLYRKGIAFKDPDSVNDAIETAQSALKLPDAQEITGPLSGRNRTYRFTLNIFLADAYLEQALAATDLDSKNSLIAKAETQIAEINGFLGSLDNAIGQKYAGLMALARGERSKAISILYKTYESSRALDKSGERSNVDPLLCVVLAQIMKEENQLGMQREFLERAIVNNTPIILQNPQLILEYAELMSKMGAWSNLSEQVQDYQNRYGATERSMKLLIEVTTAAGEFEKAEQLLSSAGLPKAVELELRLQIALNQYASIQRQAAADITQPKPVYTAEQTKQMENLRLKWEQLLDQLLNASPESVKPQTLASICGDLMQNGKSSKAASFLDLYLKSYPDAIDFKVLRARMDMQEPGNITNEQQFALQNQVYNQIEDPLKKALALSQFYRSQNKQEESLKIINELSGDEALNSDLLMERFEIAIEQQDVQTAESLIPKFRQANIDGYEGILQSGQLEIMKKNYPLAIRRLDECLNLNPLDSSIYFLKSQIYHQQENLDEASKSAVKSVQMNPQNPVYARNLASILFARNSALGNKVTIEQRSEAERAITAAMYLNPGDWQLQSVYAESIQLQAPDRALLIRQRLLDSYPTASNAVMLGNMAIRMAQSETDNAKKTGLIELAGKSYERATAIDPDYQTAREAYADYLQMTQKQEQALDLLKDDNNLLWKFYLRNGQFEKAEELLIKLHQDNPKDPMLLRGLIITAEGKNDRAKLRQYLDQLAETDQNKETELLVLQKYLDAGFSLEAEKRLAGFKERYPGEKTALLIEAWTEMSHGRLNESMSLTNRYLESDTNHAGAWRLRGRLNRLINQPQKAIDDLQRSKSLADNSAIRIELATVYLESKQTSAAVGELVIGLQDPQAPIQMRLMLESIYQQTKQTAELEKLYAETLMKYPQSVFWHSRAGRYFLSSDRLAPAQVLLQKAWDLSLQQGSGDISALFNNLDCLYYSQKYDEAFSIASGLVDSQFAPVAYAYMGQIHAKKTQNDKAVECYFKALDKAGTNEWLQNSIATKILESLGEEPVNQWISNKLAADSSSIAAHLLASQIAEKNSLFNKAIEPIDQCLKITPKDSPAWIGFALKKANLMIQAYAKTSDLQYLGQSIDLFKSVLEIQPDNPSLLNNLAYLLADNDQDIDLALSYARKAHQQDPGNAIYLDTYAFAQCKAGDYQSAEQNLLRAVQLHEALQADIPWDLYKHLGMARQALAKNQLAIEAYQQALNSSVDSLGDKKQQIPEIEKQELQQLIEKLQQSGNNKI